jgi:hypothetical protein
VIAADPEARKTRYNALMAYVDGFLLAVPKKNLAKYRAMAKKSGSEPVTSQLRMILEFSVIRDESSLITRFGSSSTTSDGPTNSDGGWE